MGLMQVLCNRGEENVLSWGDTPAEIELARETFERYKAKNFTWFALDGDDDRGEKITQFNPNLHERRMVAVPQMQGG